ncbi:MAG: S8 family serine peptidase [Candidatus Thermoplasmatota archaeon]|nr:S8 family serine peptidase [Candidatus Thermoplasmatota archaeon]
MRRGFWVMLILAILVSSTSTAGLTKDLNSAGDLSKMDTDLVEYLLNDNSIEVIVQFTTPMDSQKWIAIENIGLETLGVMHVLHGGLFEGTPNQIRQLSLLDDVFFIERNRLLEHFYLPGDPTDPSAMMHETVHVVNSALSWHRAIIDRDGNVIFDNLAFAEWDGDGTTAVDLDTGIDGEHPDFDCGEPWTGEKLIWSAKWSGVAWIDAPNCNSDTSSGHGTHVGGTIAGNGDASAGRRLGTAKGAQIVALGTGDGASIFAAEQGLEWTYENSRPGLNDFNIRVVSNSWGTNGDYNPSNVIAQLTNKLTYENSVAVIFAASNSGGSGAEGDGDLRTNVYANTPSAISVAALTHDGGAVTSFSSRGWINQQHTWPDVGAPGRDIWATAPRATAIDASTRTQGDLYYMSISGTSMATPHIGGIATVLIDVAPSLGTAHYQYEDHDEGTALVTGQSAQGYQNAEWFNSNETRVHEVELILELTAQYDILKNQCEDGNDEDSCNDIPENCYISNQTNRCHDWRVGHGLVHVDHAVALARTLELLRDTDGDGFVDNPEVTVWDANEYYMDMMEIRQIPLETDQLSHAWKGEWSHFNNGPSSTFGTYATDDRHYVWIPNGTIQMEVAFTSLEWNTDNAQIAQIRPNIDLGEDGNDDAAGQGTRTGDTLYIVMDIDEEHWGKWCEFDVTGTAITLFTEVLSGSEFAEPRVPYTVDVLLKLDISEPLFIEFEQRLDGYTDLDPAIPSSDYDPKFAGNLVYIRPVYDESRIPIWQQEITVHSGSDMPIGLITLGILITLILVGSAIAIRNKLEYPEVELTEAVLIEEDEIQS